MILERDELEAMSEGLISKAIDLARSRLAQAERDRAELDRVIVTAQEEERLLTRLLALRKGEPAPEPSVGTSNNERAEKPRSGVIPSESAGGVAKHSAVEAVIHELIEAGRPVHISDLMRLLRARGVAIPGSGTQANLITHLRRDARLMRASRGMYGLTEWGLEEMQPAVRRRRRKRRVGSRGSQRTSGT